MCVKSQDMANSLMFPSVNRHHFQDSIIRSLGSNKPFRLAKTAHMFPLMQKWQLITLFCFDAVSVCFLQ